MQSIHGITEKELINRLINGDQTAFELLFHAYYSGLVVYASQFTFDKDEAEEIVQDFFVRCWQKHHSIQPHESLRNYFFSSIKNRSLNYLKHKKIQEYYIQQLSVISESHLVYNQDLYSATELQEKIKNSISLLPERCREIFTMSRIQGLKNEEIALELNLSKRTVETQISHALKVLRVELKEYSGLLIILGLISY
ncbi:MAG: RNA polymerase sigma-70 factor [Mariniphaga sp.]